MKPRFLIEFHNNQKNFSLPRPKKCWKALMKSESNQHRMVQNDHEAPQKTS